MTTAKLWRVVADAREPHDAPLELLRILVVADVLRRVIEDVQGGQVLLAVLEPADVAPSLEAHLLQAREPVGRGRTPEDGTALTGGPADITVGSAAFSTAPLAAATFRRMRVGAVTIPGEGASASRLSEIQLDDPLALRLALLRIPYGEPAVLTRARLHRADETLHRWRLKVAAWADMPSAPAAREPLDAARAALSADLDTRSVLTGLHHVEIDHDIASGSKFETFAHLDRVLALDLCRLIGQLPR